jgi:hypothetical protein
MKSRTVVNYVIVIFDYQRRIRGCESWKLSIQHSGMDRFWGVNPCLDLHRHPSAAQTDL